MDDKIIGKREAKKREGQERAREKINALSNMKGFNLTLALCERESHSSINI